MLGLVLLIFALALFVIASFLQPDQPWRGRLGLLGLACWVGAEIVSRTLK